LPKGSWGRHGCFGRGIRLGPPTSTFLFIICYTAYQLSNYRIGPLSFQPLSGLGPRGPAP
jgi:hypothetical protein